MKLIFAVLDVSLTMGLTRCYKTEGFFYIHNNNKFLWWGASVIISVPTSVRVAAAFQLCSTARHFRDRRLSGPI